LVPKHLEHASNVCCWNFVASLLTFATRNGHRLQRVGSPEVVPASCCYRQPQGWMWPGQQMHPCQRLHSLPCMRGCPCAGAMPLGRSRSLSSTSLWRVSCQRCPLPPPSPSDPAQACRPAQGPPHTPGPFLLTAPLSPALVSSSLLLGGAAGHSIVSSLGSSRGERNVYCPASL